MKHNWLYINDEDLNVRYVLGDVLSNKPLICIGLNPSTAKPDNLDQTLKMVKLISEKHNYNGWVMLNIYPLRGTKPENLPHIKNEQITKQNLYEIEKILYTYSDSDILCAWGDIIETKSYLLEILENNILNILKKHKERLKCLDITDDGNPHHPLFISTDSEFINFENTKYKL